MNKLRNNVDMGFTEELFPEGTHMCLIYDDEEERKQIIGQFLAKGIECGEKVFYFADTMTPGETDVWLQNMGITLPKDRSDGALEVIDAVQAYCPNGRFVLSEVLTKLRGHYDDAIAAGCTGARVSGEASWALRGIPGSERLLEYEALVNTIVKTHPIIPVCQYDARRFDGATLLNVLKVHPLMIVKGTILQNPYYVAPEEFLSQLGIPQNREDLALTNAVA